MKFKIEKIGEKYFLHHCINGDKGPTIGVYTNYDAANHTEDNFEVFEIPSKKEKHNDWASLFFIISFACFIFIAIFGASKAKAQDIITSTNNAIMMTQLASIDTSSPTTTRPEPPKKPVTLYRERVPGKPEEGFVPVTATPTAPPRYVQDRIRMYGTSIEMLDDKEKGIKCYSITYANNNAISCVKY